jgi:pyruvate/2-oxoglutarate dehydrogenase complex dihydrolipoamide dehydrogenase (E3) component
LVNGCVPSKAFIAAANIVHTVKKRSQEFGVTIKGEVQVDFGKIMERMRKIRAQLSENDTVERFNNYLGCDVYLGTAKFLSKNEVEVNGKVLKFLRCTIATGGRPVVPNFITGANEIPYYTSENIFNLTH